MKQQLRTDKSDDLKKEFLDYYWSSFPEVGSFGIIKIILRLVFVFLGEVSLQIF